MIRDFCFESCRKVIPSLPDELTRETEGKPDNKRETSFPLVLTEDLSQKDCRNWEEACFVRVSDIDEDGRCETVLGTLEGNIFIMKDEKIHSYLAGNGISTVSAFVISEGFLPQHGNLPVIYQLFNNGSLIVTHYSLNGILISESYADMPVNALSCEVVKLFDKETTLVVCAKSSLYFYNFNNAFSSFGLLSKIEVESEAHSLDLILGKFLIVGLTKGPVLAFEALKVPEKHESSSKILRVNFERIKVKSGCEPPLPRFDTSYSIAEATVKGYSPLKGRSISDIMPVTVVQFAVAWADGRICLCEIVQKYATDPADKIEYFWQAVSCVHTGLNIFSLNFVTISMESTDEIADQFDHHHADEEIFQETITQSFSHLPNIVCCFESDTLLNNISDRFRQDSEGNFLLLRDFTIQFCEAIDLPCAAVAVVADEVIVSNPTIAPRLLLNSRSRSTSAATDISHLDEQSIMNTSNMIYPVFHGSDSHIGGSKNVSGTTTPFPLATISSDVVEVPIKVLSTIIKSLSLWYLTGNGRIFCVPKADEQFLRLGSRIFFRELTTSNIDFISTTLVDWLLEPDLVPGDHAEEVMDLLLEYFKGISDVLIACNKTKERRNEPLTEQNRKHLAMYVINEINLFSSKDLENFVGDVNNLLTDIDPKKRRSSANKK